MPSFGALKQIHAILNPDQRGRLAYLLRSGVLRIRLIAALAARSPKDAAMNGYSDRAAACSVPIASSDLPHHRG